MRSFIILLICVLAGCSRPSKDPEPTKKPLSKESAAAVSPLQSAKPASSQVADPDKDQLMADFSRICKTAGKFVNLDEVSAEERRLRLGDLGYVTGRMGNSRLYERNYMSGQPKEFWWERLSGGNWIKSGNHLTYAPDGTVMSKAWWIEGKLLRDQRRDPLDPSKIVQRWYNEGDELKASTEVLDKFSE